MTATRTQPRVAMVINSLQRGGAETQFLRAARALRAAGAEVRLFTILADNDFAEQLDGLTVTQFSPRPGPATLTGAVRALREWRPHVVLNFLYQATLVGRVAARAARTPVVISSMRNERLETRLRALLFRATQGLDSVTTTNSPRAARAIEQSGTVRRGTLRVIPNGLSVDTFAGAGRERVRAELGIADDVVLFVGMGRLAPQKDWPTLVEAVGRYRGPAAHWAIAGDGPDRAALQRAVDAAGLAGRVTLLGLRNDAPALLAAADALVLTSTYEGLPNVVLEAMAASRPVVATQVGDCPDLVRPEFGLLVDVGAPAQLAAAMAELAQRPAGQRAAMGAGAQAHVAATYSLDAVGEQWVELVDESLVASRAGTGVARMRPWAQQDPAAVAGTRDRTISDR